MPNYNNIVNRDYAQPELVEAKISDRYKLLLPHNEIKLEKISYVSNPKHYPIYVTQMYLYGFPINRSPSTGSF